MSDDLERKEQLQGASDAAKEKPQASDAAGDEGLERKEQPQSSDAAGDKDEDVEQPSGFDTAGYLDIIGNVKWKPCPGDDEEELERKRKLRSKVWGLFQKSIFQSRMRKYEELHARTRTGGGKPKHIIPIFPCKICDCKEHNHMECPYLDEIPRNAPFNRNANFLLACTYCNDILDNYDDICSCEDNPKTDPFAKRHLVFRG